MNNFNRVSSYYDPLSRLIFGNSLRHSQILYLDDIPENGNVLILGGGTGWLLAELLRKKPSVNVWYVDAASAMIGLAKKKVSGLPHERIRFIHGTQDAIPAEVRFDAAITYFLMDLFTTPTVFDIISKVKNALVPEGLWLMTDFVKTEKRWHRMLLKSMYYFFRHTSGVEAKELPPWEPLMLASGLSIEKEEFFYNGFIKAVEFLNMKGH